MTEKSTLAYQLGDACPLSTSGKIWNQLLKSLCIGLLCKMGKVTFTVSLKDHPKDLNEGEVH